MSLHWFIIRPTIILPWVIVCSELAANNSRIGQLTLLNLRYKNDNVENVDRHTNINIIMLIMFHRMHPHLFIV